jgi:hypothetical protein
MPDPARTDYWREAQGELTPADYPDVNAQAIDFPQQVYIAFAVCHKGCGRREFIVDGSTQVCHYCGKMMFRICSRQYTLDNTKL